MFKNKNVAHTAATIAIALAVLVALYMSFSQINKLQTEVNELKVEIEDLR